MRKLQITLIAIVFMSASVLSLPRSPHVDWRVTNLRTWLHSVKVEARRVLGKPAQKRAAAAPSPSLPVSSEPTTTPTSSTKAAPALPPAADPAAPTGGRKDGRRYRFSNTKPVRTFMHSRSMKTQTAYSAVSVVAATSGMPLTGGHDFHEMSVTLYVPGPFANGESVLWGPEKRLVTMPPTLAVAIGRSSGYDSYPGETLHDGKLYAYALSTYCAAEGSRNHQFLYLGGRKRPVEISPRGPHRIEMAYTGERRWITFEHKRPKRGVSADWSDHQDHWAYLWTTSIDGKPIAKCWLNAPYGYIKYECNKVQAHRPSTVNVFSQLRGRRHAEREMRPVPIGDFADTSDFGDYDVTRSQDAVTFAMTRKRGAKR